MVMALRGSVLRPALRDGTPDITRGLVYRFPYDPERFTDSEENSETAVDSAAVTDNTSAGIESDLNEAQ
jgi:hypothetical protein